MMIQNVKDLEVGDQIAILRTGRWGASASITPAVVKKITKTTLRLEVQDGEDRVFNLAPDGLIRRERGTGTGSWSDYSIDLHRPDDPEVIALRAKIRLSHSRTRAHAAVDEWLKDRENETKTEEVIVQMTAYLVHMKENQQ